ncbi:Cysteine protease atg4 [Arachnomyces sp. PD_36]|nr:Cysteine protease atg4 [Arachnomyces sp. PD_36]
MSEGPQPEMNNVDLGQYKRIVQYFWDPEPKNNEEPGSPIWCLGKEHGRAAVPQEHNAQTPHEPALNGPGNNGVGRSESPTDSQNATSPRQVEAGGSTEDDRRVTATDPTENGWPASFVDDFESKIWLTYRSGFPPIPKSKDPDAALSMSLTVRLRSQLVDSHGFTTDTGWGCMIRSGQSLLANSLSILRLGRDWRRGTHTKEESRLLSLFADDPSAPFSIHRFVEYGATACGKYPGEWFGPSATAKCIQALSTECEDAGLRVYVTNDSSDVYEEQFRQVACGSDGGMQPTLILLAIRLGIDRVTPVYWEALRAILRCPQSVGIAGGRPSSSHYFVAVQGSSIFFLDPHHTRPAVPPRGGTEDYAETDRDTYHTRRLRRLHIKEMDPSMLIGFLIKDEDDWTAWKRNISTVPGKAIIHVSDREPPLYGTGQEREGALDEVEALDDDSEPSNSPCN